MIIIPREKPAVSDLNSYYLKIDKLLEHYQGALGTGGVYFKSPTSEGVVFFDEDNLLNGYYKDKKVELKGGVALSKINETASKNNYSVTVYYILPERVYYWANLSDAEQLYSDLSSEFTDLEGLIKKMENEKVTGYIDVKLNQNSGGGLLFIYNGGVIGGASARGDGELDRSVEYRDDLIKRSREVGGIFNVKKIQLSKITTLSKTSVLKPSKPSKPKVQSQKDPQRVLSMLQDLLVLLERVVRSNKRIKVDFETLLNKQFVDKVDQYDFLDPFAGEFRYSNGKVTFNGRASQKELVTSIVECVKDMSAGLGVTAVLRKYLATWKKNYLDEIIDFNIEI
ncbi:MAG: hypothetical protein HF978_14120 [Desulfobacteraceae bacterium]|nr:hypothetical protein [Desulfobacteraceae bacterium]MBC2756675.1 hypothetical protein [Desulfobacteraceae bacterium]